MKTPLCLAAAAPFVALGCATTSSTDQLRAQAAFDMACPAEQLTFDDIAGRRTVQGVTGCGKRASYVFEPRSGAWIRNGSDAAPAPAAPTAAGPASAPPAPAAK